MYFKLECANLQEVLNNDNNNPQRPKSMKIKLSHKQNLSVKLAERKRDVSVGSGLRLKKSTWSKHVVSMIKCRQRSNGNLLE